MYIYIYYARNRTHVCLRGGAAACAPIPISHTSIYMPIHTYIKHIHTCIYIYIYISRMYIYIYYARNRTHVCMRGGAAACAPIPVSRTSIYMPIHICMYIYNACIHIYTNIDIRIHTCV